MDLNTLKGIIDVTAASATVIAIIVGGYWTYMLFVKTRQKYPRAKIEHNITQKHLSHNKLLLHVAINISNTGSVLLSPISGEIRIQQLIPLSFEIQDSINKGKDPVEDKHTEVLWPLIARKELKLKKGDLEIEPGESDQILYDFILDADIQTIQIYSYFKNDIKYHREIGWPLTTVYDILPK